MYPLGGWPMIRLCAEYRQADCLKDGRNMGCGIDNTKYKGDVRYGLSEKNGFGCFSYHDADNGCIVGMFRRK
ncbi:hypothetical protein D3C79_974160 [compost metagenome]